MLVRSKTNCGRRRDAHQVAHDLERQAGGDVDHEVALAALA
jgi:hypothetical protein